MKKENEKLSLKILEFQNLYSDLGVEDPQEFKKDLNDTRI